MPLSFLLKGVFNLNKNKLEQKVGIQPSVRESLLLLGWLEEDTPQNGAVADGTESVADENYTIESPVGDDFNDYKFTLTSSNEADSKVVIAEDTDKEYLITAGDDADADAVELALEEQFDGNWTVTADGTQTGSDFDGEIITLTGGQYATEADQGELTFDSDNLYVATDDIVATSTAGWVEISHSDVT